MKRSSITYLFIWFLLLLLYAGLRSHTFFAPLGHDDGLFLYGGQAWAAGEVAYRDFWDHKPPGIFFFHSLPFRLFPFSVPAAKWHQILWLSISATVLWAFCKRRFLPSTSILCVAAYVFYTSTPYTIRTGGLTEENALFFIVLCFWLILRRKGTLVWNSFFAGLALGVAIQFRQTYLFDVPFVIGALLHNAHYRGEKFKDVLQPFLAIFLGMGIPELWISTFFWLQGEWFTYIESSYLTNFYYIGPARKSLPWAEVLRDKHGAFILSTGPYLLSPLLALAARHWVPQDIRWMYLPLVLAFAGDMVSVTLSGEYYEHYYVQAAVSTALLLAMTAEGLLQRGKTAWQAGWSPATGLYSLTTLLIVLLCLWTWRGGALRFVHDVQGIWLAQSQEEGPYAMQRSVGQAVGQITAPEDRILLIGRSPNSVYLFAQRYAGARYYHYAPLWKEKLYGMLQESHILAYLDDVKRHRPVVLVVDLTSQLRGEQGLQRVTKYIPELSPYIEENYTPLDEAVTTIPTAWFWYDIRVQLLIRNDRIEDIQKRMAKKTPFVQ
ncbi:MAG: glycosyltransferase family 39 protein [bacterium]|jgi:hypothetical protein|nr:glycosyltransferase family 39 protein [bacterium]